MTYNMQIIIIMNTGQGVTHAITIYILLFIRYSHTPTRDAQTDVKIDISLYRYNDFYNIDNIPLKSRAIPRSKAFGWLIK